MQEKLDKAFDRSLRDKFREFSEEPSPAVWEQIAVGLDRPDRKRLPYAWLAAACVVIFASVLLWPKQEPEEMILAKAPIINLPAAETASAKQENFKNPAIVQIDKKVVPNSVRYEDRLDSSNELMVVVSSSADVPAAQKELNLQPAASTPVVAEAVVASPMPDMDIAANTSAVMNDPEDSADSFAPKQKKGLGKLVNFVLSQVDPRADKLIEVSEDAGEGLHITGLNLGLIKLKNKTSNK